MKQSLRTNFLWEDEIVLAVSIERSLPGRKRCIALSTEERHCCLNSLTRLRNTAGV